MKKFLCMGAALLLLAACGSDDPAAPTDAAEAVIEDTAQEPAADVAETPGEAETSDEVLEVVEESAAEPESGEQQIVLAQREAVEPAPPAREWKYKENQHYFRLVPTQPTVGGADKIEVAEFFWYGCPHCFDFEKFINPWAADKPANVSFVRVPAMWNAGLKMHAQLYYTEEVLGRNGVIKDPAAFHEAVFNEYHRRGNRLGSEASIQALFARFDVSADDFQRAWKSFEVSQKLRVAEDLARRYGIQNVPTVVVNGKYRTGGAEAGSYPNLIEVINELIAREGAR
ncbi:MAG: DsbA family protein [Gammaproteobacteria bacterium]|nr:DsbA family protein [Gammaproteobacteria bacterium]MDH5303141.1 DsbA family protein [Gammaproteobacteria bacterium]MDH5320851.1 DsbA family protein [Gammaproteobacteria bacterium]